MAEKEYSGLAITGFILSLSVIFSIFGLIFSGLALYKIPLKKQKGKGLAIAGLVIGLIISMPMVIVIVWAVISGFNTAPNNSNLDINNSSTSSINSQSEQFKVYKFGDKVTIGNFAYTFNSYETKSEIGSYILDNFYGEKADGIFLIIDVTIENIGKESETLWSSYVSVIDDQNRKFESDTMAGVYLDDAFSFEQLNPGLPKRGKIVFDVSKDLKGFIEISNSNVWSDEKKYVSW
jgi:hypothetical protein